MIDMNNAKWKLPRAIVEIEFDEILRKARQKLMEERYYESS